MDSTFHKQHGKRTSLEGRYDFVIDRSGLYCKEVLKPSVCAGYVSIHSHSWTALVLVSVFVITQ